jgi:sugar phosphate permease
MFAGVISDHLFGSRRAPVSALLYGIMLGGLKNAGVAVGIIDGFVYLGTAVQDFVYGHTLPEKKTAAAAVIGNWRVWPEAMIAPAAIGLVLAILLWNARPQKATGTLKVVPAPAELPRAQVVANE